MARLTRRVWLPAAVVIGLLAAGGVAAAVLTGGSGGRSAGRPGAGGVAGHGPVPSPVLALVGDHLGVLPWQQPVTVAVSHGRLRSVAVVLAGTGDPLSGKLSAGGTQWTSTGMLAPLAGYYVFVQYANLAGRPMHGVLSFHTGAPPAADQLTGELSPDQRTVGVGELFLILANQWVPPAARAAVAARFTVTSNPPQAGAWHWVSGTEMHWRPPAFWRPYSQVSVQSNLTGLYIGDGIWGVGAHHTSFDIGASHISIANVATHVMTVYDNGRVVRVIPISAGRATKPTSDGVHIALEKNKVVDMDSATNGVPVNSPGGYNLTVYWDVRITDSGEYVHAAPWSLSEQGNANVSHGCINASPANAEWFYNFSQLGDVVEVVNSPQPPSLTDPGTEDWNLDWAEWTAPS